MNQKLDNLLELSLDVPESTREKSENLSAGYNTADNLWQIIVRYSGDWSSIWNTLTGVSPTESFSILFGGYAIAEVTESQLQQLSQHPRVEFIEKPKALSFAVYEGKLASCIPPVQRTPYNLTGRGILVGVVDSGIDIFHPDFRNEDGTTRIIGLWDQTTGVGSHPSGYSLGTFFSREEINRALESEGNFPSSDRSGHGTHVTGIAAGNGRASRGENRGVAYEADLLIVKLGAGAGGGFPQTAELMMAVDFCVKTAVERNQPLALNLSFGNSYGTHDGTSLLETYLDMVAGIGKTTICIGSGNEGNKSRHEQVILSEEQDYLAEFQVAPGESGLGIQIWKRYADEIRLILQAPSGNRIILSENSRGTYRYVLDGTEIVWYFGEPAPYSASQEIYLDMVPEGVQETIRSGIWKLTFQPIQITYGILQLWMPSGGTINSETGFLVFSTEDTLTIPSTAMKPITVAAYDSRTMSFAPFSGRGFVCCHLVKPDLAAPGVDILSCAPGGGYTTKTGTSMACPFVTGSAALLMQLGIINGQDPYLYGQKVKAYLTGGAKALPAFREYPNDSIGWGVLCLRDSLPG